MQYKRDSCTVLRKNCFVMPRPCPTAGHERADTEANIGHTADTRRSKQGGQMADTRRTHRGQSVETRPRRNQGGHARTKCGGAAKAKADPRQTQADTWRTSSGGTARAYRGLFFQRKNPTINCLEKNVAQRITSRSFKSLDRRNLHTNRPGHSASAS